jgi:hypothetical protein
MTCAVITYIAAAGAVVGYLVASMLRVGGRS